LLMLRKKRPTVYRNRKRNIWTKEWLERSIFWQGKVIICGCARDFETKMRTVWESVMNQWHGTAAPKHVHTHFKLLHHLIIAQRNSNLFENCQNFCTKSQTTPHTVKLFAQKPVFCKLLGRVWGPLCLDYCIWILRD
jgi:hypothetical protein